MSKRESGNLDTYYRDHWVDIEPERMSRYESMFQWRDGHEALIAPAQIGAGQTVADYGCGPGGLAIELARRVGENGSVIGLDINAAFLDRTRILAEQQQLADRIETKLIKDDRIPLSDHAVDRILCKNVLEYVPDPGNTIAEFYRVLKPSGIAHVSDSDWGAVIFEPSGETFARIMDAAAVAFRTPLIGRRLYGMFHSAGFTNIQVQVLASADTSGALQPVLTNMASYARLSGKLEESEIAAFLDDIDRALQDGTYFAVLPQFLVTGVAGESAE
jgi:ubiquinone/menaquinone biosynthesis C-methylase UbiE